MKIAKLFSLLLISTLIITSCSSDDNESPNVVISSPGNNEVFNPGDTIILQAKITDDEMLTSVNVSSNLGINENIVVLDSDTEHNANYNIPLPLNVSLGTFEITVSGTDNDGKSSEDSVEITIQ
jgi:hypothetical protein